MNSMERQLQVGLAAILLLLMLSAWYVVNQSVQTLVEDFVVSRLKHDAQSMIGALEPDPAFTRVRWRGVSDIYNKVDSGHYYVFAFTDGRVITSPSLWDQTPQVPKVAPNDEAVTRIETPDGQTVLVWAKQFEKDGQGFTLAVAEDLEPMLAQIDRLKRNFAGLLAFGFASLLVLQSWLVRRSFRKLDPIRQDIKSLEQGKRDKLREEVPSEIQPLVRSFNHLLALLTTRLERSRNSLGNLTHALKGPLNLLIQQLHESDQLNGKGLKEARDQTERLHFLIERELKRARMAGRGISGQQFDAGRDLPDLIGVMQQTHRDKQLEIIAIGATAMPLFGDREDLLELIGNILDNACKWANGKVVCRMSLDETYRITIEDDGAGLPKEKLDQLIMRGVRLDESVGGTGLGLSIAKDIVSLYGGTMRFDLSEELGGLRVDMTLPLIAAK